MDLTKILKFLKPNKTQNKKENEMQCVFCLHVNDFPKHVTLILGYHCARCNNWNFIS